MGTAGPNVTQCGLLGRGRPSYQAASGSTERFGRNTPTLQTDRRRYYSIGQTVFGRPFVKRFTLCHRTTVLFCLSCLSCLLWPNAWMDLDATWYGGRRRPWRHCVRWRPSSPQKGVPPYFSAHDCCCQMPGGIKMPLGSWYRDSLGPGDIKLDGGPSSLT